MTAVHAPEPVLLIDLGGSDDGGTATTLQLKLTINNFLTLLSPE
jgi:hypothetical protein